MDLLMVGLAVAYETPIEGLYRKNPENQLGVLQNQVVTITA